MILWCAYCQHFVGEKPPYDNFEITHGICPSCGAREVELTDADVMRARRLGALHSRLMEYGRAGDALSASALIDDARAEGIEPVDVVVGLLAPALQQLGDAWEHGKATIVDEHRFTAFAESLVAIVTEHYESPPTGPDGRVSVLLVNADGNAHSLGVRIVRLWLQSRGVSSVAIYPGTPARELVTLALAVRPATLGISIALPEQAGALGEIVERVQAIPELSGLRIVLGGNAVKRGLVPAVPGTTLMRDFQDLLEPISMAGRGAAS